MHNVFPWFQKALPFVQPSAKREGFATVPDVTWNDIGALEDIREELKMAIMVNYIHKVLYNLVFKQMLNNLLMCFPWM